MGMPPEIRTITLSAQSERFVEANSARLHIECGAGWACSAGARRGELRLWPHGRCFPERTRAPAEMPGFSIDVAAHSRCPLSGVKRILGKAAFGPLQPSRRGEHHNRREPKRRIESQCSDILSGVSGLSIWCCPNSTVMARIFCQNTSFNTRLWLHMRGTSLDMPDENGVQEKRLFDCKCGHSEIVIFGYR
jgi:hypothetical protein